MGVNVKIGKKINKIKRFEFNVYSIIYNKIIPVHDFRIPQWKYLLSILIKMKYVSTHNDNLCLIWHGKFNLPVCSQYRSISHLYRSKFVKVSGTAFNQKI
jgi:hypothetical protein